MSFDVTYGDDPDMVTHDTCCRCQLPCEMSRVGTGRVPTGPGGCLEDIRNIVLCTDCLALMNELPKKFWYEGWPRQPRRK